MHSMAITPRARDSHKNVMKQNILILIGMTKTLLRSELCAFIHNTHGQTGIGEATVRADC